VGFSSETPVRIYVGAGEVYIDGTPIGATQEANQFRINRSYVDIPKFNGVKGKVRKTDYVSEEVAQLEMNLSELAFDQLSLVLPGIESAASADATGGGVSTLAAGVAIGDDTFDVQAGDGALFTPGTWVLIGTGAGAEHVLVRSIATDTITVAIPFTKVHASADDAIEQTGSGGTIISSRPGRLDSDDYAGVVELRVPGVDGRFASFRVFDAISVDNFEIEVSDETNARYPLTFEGRYNENDPALAPWLLELQETAVS
jgi:hypothetical protein